MLPTVAFADGTQVPALGQGTWHMGEDPSRRAAEAAVLREGIEHGLTLLDTAEMYGDGAAEEVVGEAIRGVRERVFLVSKVLPHNASRRAMGRACDASLRRLGTGWIDLYLLHWRGGVALAETVEAFEGLRAQGRIRRWGVSNLDVADLAELGPALGGCAANQILWNLEHRGVEFDLLPFCAGLGMPVMAYSPLGQGGRLLRHRALADVAHRHGVEPAAVALAFVLRRQGVIAIPKAATPAHLRANLAATALRLEAADVSLLDGAFHPPRRKVPMEMI